MTIRDFQTIYRGEVEIIKDWNIFKFEGDNSDIPETLLDAEIEFVEPHCVASDYNWIRIYI